VAPFSSAALDNGAYNPAYNNKPIPSFPWNPSNILYPRDWVEGWRVRVFWSMGDTWRLREERFERRMWVWERVERSWRRGWNNFGGWVEFVFDYKSPRATLTACYVFDRVHEPFANHLNNPEISSTQSEGNLDWAVKNHLNNHWAPRQVWAVRQRSKKISTELLKHISTA